MQQKKATSRDLAQQRTRETLLAVAARLVAEKGIGAVSIGDIAGEAGYTKGAFYSNFDSRETMLLDLVQRIQIDQAASMRELEAEGPAADFASALDQLVEVALRHDASLTAALLIGEVQLQARRNPDFARHVEAGFEERLRMLERWIDAMPKAPAGAPALSSRDLARVVFALSQGLAQQPADHAVLRGLLRQAFGRLFGEI
jgi:AcrR family transcriptional regulator